MGRYIYNQDSELKLRSLAVIIFTFIVVACSSTGKNSSEYAYQKDHSYSDMVKLHYRQSETKRGYKYEAYQLIAEHNKFWPPIAKKCRPLMLNEGIDAFEFIFVVNSLGKVIDARSEVESEGVNCFLSGVKQIKYPQPPFENWYELVSVK